MSIFNQVFSISDSLSSGDNASSESDPSKYYSTRAVIIGLYTAVGLLGLLANILLLATACSHAKLRRRTATGGSVGSGGVYTHYGVAGFDLAFLLVNLPMQLVNYLYYDNWAVDRVVFGDEFEFEDHFASLSCKAFHYIPAVVYGAHVMFLVGLSIERLIVAVFPLGLAARNPACLMLVNVLASLALALVMALPQLLVTGTRLGKYERISNTTWDLTYRCGNLWEKTSSFSSRELAFRIYVQTAYVWLPIVLVQFCYTALLLHLGRRGASIGALKIAGKERIKGGNGPDNPPPGVGRNNRVHPNEGGNNSSRVIIGARRARNLRLNLTVGLTTAVFFASWAPFSVANLVSTASDPLREFLRLFGYSSAAVNTGVYAFLNPAQRAHLRRLIVGLTFRFTESIRACCLEQDANGEVSESRSAPDPPQLPGSNGGIGQAGQISGSSTFKQQLKQQIQPEQQRQQQQQQQLADQEQQRRMMRRDTRSTRLGVPAGGTMDR